MSEERPLEEILQDAEQELARCRSLDVQHQRSREDGWIELAGREAVEAMLQSKETTVDYLQHPQPKYRLAALSIMGNHWKPDATFATVCERMGLHDPDVHVRGTALIHLGRCYSSTSDVEMGRLLASVVRNEAEPAPLRTSAYHALFDVSGFPPSAWPTIKIATGSFRFPEDVDWRFVEQFLSDG